MVKYFIRCQIFPVAESYFYVSAVAVPEGAPREGVISRHHECGSRWAAEGMLEILRGQVVAAVAAVQGEVVDENHNASLTSR